MPMGSIVRVWSLPAAGFATTLSVLIAVAAAQSNWIDFTSAEGKLSVSVPCQPSVTSDRVPGPPAFTSSVFMCAAQAGGVYTFGWVEFEPGYSLAFEPVLRQDAELIANRDNLLKTLGATLLTSNMITVGDRRTLEFTANRNDTQLVTSRVFIAGGRPYQIAVITPVKEDHSANIRRFLSSFEPSAR
jgi:hypothetical protein